MPLASISRGQEETVGLHTHGHTHACKHTRALVYTLHVASHRPKLYSRGRGKRERGKAEPGGTLRELLSRTQGRLLEDRGRGEASIILWFVGLATTGVFANLR
jgi:hypothetical protein